MFSLMEFTSLMNGYSITWTWNLISYQSVPSLNRTWTYIIMRSLIMHLIWLIVQLFKRPFSESYHLFVSSVAQKMTQSLQSLPTSSYTQNSIMFFTQMDIFGRESVMHAWYQNRLIYPLEYSSCFRNTEHELGEVVNHANCWFRKFWLC